MEDEVSVARLIAALRPWLGHLVDLALSLRAPLTGDISEALARAGFGPTFLGEDTPPVTRYSPEDDAGFYAEFLLPLEGGELTRRGKRDVTVERAGITAQKLRHLDVLLVAPWSVHVGPDADIPLEPPADVPLSNPVSFIIQKLLIHEKRPPNKQAQDLLYIHDTLELFGGALGGLRTVWRDLVRPSMPEKTARRAQTLAGALFASVTDTIREAARIQEARRLSSENLRAASEYGLGEILDVGPG
jgi:hypothetical protein